MEVDVCNLLSALDSSLPMSISPTVCSFKEAFDFDFSFVNVLDFVIDFEAAS